MTEKLKTLLQKNFEKLWKAIEQMEGYKKGKIIEVCPIIRVRKNKDHVIYEYCIKDNSWISKEKCLELAQQGKLDVEICKSRLGRIYLRARAKSTIQNDLGKIIEKKSIR